MRTSGLRDRLRIRGAGAVRIRSQSDFWCGLLFVAIGVAFMVFAREYRIGTSARMGPGYFPTLLGGLLAFLGLTIAVPALFRDGEPFPRLHWRPFLMLLVAIAVFGALLDAFGLVIALAALVIVAGLADPQLRFVETLGIAAFLIAFSIGIFVVLLGIPMTLWPNL